MIRRLLERSIERWALERAVHGYQSGDLSLGRAAEEAGITQWELLEAIRASGIAYPLGGQDVDERLSELFSAGFHTRLEWMGTTVETLADIPPRPGGVVLVGINLAPISVAAGHYYQGRIGKRLWRRLERLGMLDKPQAGAEDEAFARAGHGLTDLVKRPTVSPRELLEEELGSGSSSCARRSPNGIRASSSLPSPSRRAACWPIVQSTPVQAHPSKKFRRFSSRARMRPRRRPSGSTSNSSGCLESGSRSPSRTGLARSA